MGNISSQLIGLHSHFLTPQPLLSENAGSFVVLATTLVESQLSNTLLELRLEPKPDGDGEDRNLAVVSTSQIPCATRILVKKKE